MTILQAFAADLKTAAEFLSKDYNDMTVQELADGYCAALDSHDELNQNSYFAGLFLKFWYLIDKLYTKNGNALKMDREDFISWVSGAIMQACAADNRIWQTNPKIKVQQVINQIIGTRFEAAAYYESNLQKNRANFGTGSLDTVIDDENDTTMGDLLESHDLTPSEQYSSANEIVQRCLDAGKVIEAIITETIANNDCNKHESHIIKEVREDGTEYKYTQQTTTFWPYQVVKLLSNLPDNYKEYFVTNYSVNPEILETCINKIKASNNTKLYSYLNATTEYLKNYI